MSDETDDKETYDDEETDDEEPPINKETSQRSQIAVEQNDVNHSNPSTADISGGSHTTLNDDTSDKDKISDLSKSDNKQRQPQIKVKNLNDSLPIRPNYPIRDYGKEILIERQQQHQLDQKETRRMVKHANSNNVGSHSRRKSPTRQKFVERTHDNENIQFERVERKILQNEISLDGKGKNQPSSDLYQVIVLVIIILVLIPAFYFGYVGQTHTKIKLLKEIESDHLIENGQQVFRLLKGLKRDFVKLGDLTVLTFASYISNDFQNEYNHKKKFHQFKSDIVKSFLNSSCANEPGYIFAESWMSSRDVEKKIEQTLAVCGKLIWIEDVLNLKNLSLQLLRKYTDRYDINSKQGVLVVLSFDIDTNKFPPSVNSEEVMKEAFKTEMIADEVEPFMARVALNTIEYRPISTEVTDSEL